MQSMAPFRRNIIVSILFAIFGGPGIVLVYLPFWLTRFRIPIGEPWGQTALAGVLLAAGVAPLAESARRFIYAGRGTLVPTTPTERLVVSGFYRFVRNPMYVGLLIALAGEALLFERRVVLAYMAIVWLATHLFVCFYEEPALTRRYGDEYLRFKQNVPRWLPRLSPWHSAEE
jgi:protein-S-isoprenylcysteine O-methyltransferase Ste14